MGKNPLVGLETFIFCQHIYLHMTKWMWVYLRSSQDAYLKLSAPLSKAIHFLPSRTRHQQELVVRFPLGSRCSQARLLLEWLSTFLNQYGQRSLSSRLKILHFQELRMVSFRVFKSAAKCHRYTPKLHVGRRTREVQLGRYLCKDRYFSANQMWQPFNQAPCQKNASKAHPLWVHVVGGFPHCSGHTSLVGLGITTTIH